MQPLVVAKSGDSLKFAAFEFFVCFDPIKRSVLIDVWRKVGR